jgi:uncharacterized protein YbbC (DUF1343 family)
MALILVLIALSSVAWGAAPFHAAKLAEIDAEIERAIAEGKVPGAVFWMERDGQHYGRAYGQRSLAPSAEAMTMDTVFDAASLTKVVATTPAIMILIERGGIQLEAPVATYIPGFTGEGRERVTVRHLLTHVSGLRPDVDTDPPWSGYETGLTLACRERLRSEPAASFVYSDINFVLLGEMVRLVSGQPLEVFIVEQVYRPLGMFDTGFRPGPEIRSRVAPTERVNGEILRGAVHDPTARYMGGVAGHAGLFTTASDLARYARMLLHGGVLEGQRVMSSNTVSLMTRVQTPDGLVARRGLGWDIDTGYSRPRGRWFPLGSYGHTGFTGTCLWIDPFSRTFWMLLSNRVHPDGRGNVLPLQAALASRAAEAIPDFNFAWVPGALEPRDAAGSATAPAPRPVGATAVLQGIDVLARDGFAPLRGKRVGLITNHTGHDRNRKSTVRLLHEAGDVTLAALFSPEHGLQGAADERVADGRDPATGLPVYSLYGDRRRPLPEQLRELDVLVFDIQDIGCRFYTYISTMGHCLEAAAEAGLPFVVLDRVNPITGRLIEGPVHLGPPQFTAFHALPLRHGMTVGELAGMFNAERGWGANLTVIRAEGWRREAWLDETGLPWTNPSPNMRRLTAATLYPGVGLLESAVSVGRGTDTPFELVGAPYVDDVRLATALNQAGLSGVRFVPATFTPTASVFQGRACHGVQILVTDRPRCAAVDVGIALALTLQRLHPADFALAKVGPLLQHPATIEAIRQGRALAEIKALWMDDLQRFLERRRPFLLYE